MQNPPVLENHNDGSVVGPTVVIHSCLDPPGPQVRAPGGSLSRASSYNRTFFLHYN
jgi:hypothetical protein